jgi:acyl-CoA synthetase (NDP forming)
MDEVKSIFEPRKVVLIGSSKMREKVGMTSPQLFHSVAYNMKKFFKGKTVVLDTHGKKGYTDLDQISDTPDLAVIMLPPKESIPVSEKCAKIGVKALVMITGGYKDEQRRELLKLKEEYGTLSWAS